MDAKAADDIYRGRLKDLPPVHSQSVRVFTSSTFTDTAVERNALMEEVYPKLRDYCRTKYGLEFQVVDMRWGVRDEASDDHMTTALCLQEISRCQTDSIGPNFVTFLGQRHGQRPFPSTIPYSEFESLKAAVSEIEDLLLLDEWFLLDENALRPEYLLQPISSRIPNYLSTDEEERKLAQREWMKIFQDLQRILRNAANKCIQSGEIEDTAAKKYFASVTEQEIEHGLFGSKVKTDNHCLCFIRIIEDLMENLSHSLAWRFIDLSEKEVLDKEAQKFLSSLRDERIVQAIDEDHIFRSKVKWSDEGGINRDCHADYLNQLQIQFYKAMTSMVDHCMQTSEQFLQNSLLLEIHQHLKMANDRCSVFHGRERLLGQLQQRLNMSGNKPIVVHGLSGSGKTSIMAQCVQQAHDWLPESAYPNVVVRFLGTTPSSSSIQRLLENLCQHLVQLYPQDNFSPADNFSELQRNFNQLLSSATKEKPLVVILDSLDQLRNENVAHNLAWIPKRIPPHCYLILSTLPDEYDILGTLKRKYDQSLFIEVPVLSEDQCLDILMSCLRRKERTLNESQLDVVKRAFHFCELPLYVKLVYEEVSLWKSYMPIQQTQLQHTVQNVISDMFTRLNKKHGQVLVRHALGYLSVTQSGIGENELEDVLSLDDEVLTDVFQYHVPPIRRLPPILWVRIHNDISSYLVNKEVDSNQVVYWYHRQFIETARQFYLDDTRQVQKLHSLLADYWLGLWHSRNKPFIYSPYQMMKLKINNPESAEDRKVAAQPIYFSSEDKKRYNLRKLNNLPYHLYHAGRLQDLKEICLFNYDWLLSKIEAASMQQVLRDVDLLSTEDAEVRSLQNVLTLAGSTLKQAPDTLGLEIIGRLLPLASNCHTHIAKLVDHCYSECHKQNVLIPKQQCFKAPGGSLKFTLENGSIPPADKVIHFSHDFTKLYVLTCQNSILIWNLAHGELVKEVEMGIDMSLKVNVGFLSPDRRCLICACAFQTDVNPVVIFDTIDDDITLSINLENVFPAIGFKDQYLVNLINGKLLAVVINKTAAFYELISGKLLHSFNEQPSSYRITHDEKFVLFHVRTTNLIKIFSSTTYEQMDIITLTTEPQCWSVDDDDDFVIATLKNSLEIETHQLMHRVQGKIECGKRVNFTIYKAIQDHTQSIASFTTRKNHILVSTSEGFVLCDYKKAQIIKTYPVPIAIRPAHKMSNEVIRGLLTPDEKFVTAIYDEYLLVWDRKKAALTKRIRASSSQKLIDILLTEDSSTAITVSIRSRIINVWNLKNTEEESYNPLSLNSACRFISLTRNRAAVRGFEPTETRVIDVDQGEILAQPEIALEAMRPELCDDGEYMIQKLYQSEKSLCVWNSRTGKLVVRLAVPDLTFKNATISSNGALVLTHEETSPTKDVRVLLWDLNSKSEPTVFPVDEGGFAYMNFVCNDKYVVLLKQYPQEDNGTNCYLLIYDVLSKELVKKMGGLYRDNLYITNNSKQVIVVKVIDDKSEFILMDLENFDSVKAVKCLPSVPAGKLFFNDKSTRSVDAALNVRCMSTGDVLAKFHDEMGNIIKKNPQTWPKMSPCGNYVIWTAVEKGVVYAGHVDSGTVVGRCFTHAIPLSLQISERNVVVIGVDDGRIMLLHLIDTKHGDPEAFIQKVSRIQKLSKRTENGVIKHVQSNTTVCMIL